MATPDIPIGKTKVILPRRRPELLARPRLLDILYERLDRRLIIVSAPAGYGKTSLLIDLAHHSEIAFCWLALDPLDSDPQRFLSYLIAAIAERFEQFGGRSRSVLQGLTNFEEGMEPLLVTLVNEIHDQIPQHFVLVLDDYQFLDQAPSIRSFMNRFIQLMDESCHLVLASRTLPDIPDIALLVARDEVGGVDFSDLAFRPDEIRGLFLQNRQTELSDDEAQHLTEATEGWIAAIQFADLDQVRGGRNPFTSVHGTGISVFHYLGQQVVDQQEEELQLFLFRSSILEEFDARLCEEVLAPFYSEAPDWGQMLDAIRQKNLYALPVGPEGQWLRYHHLFRDYLQQRYREEYPDEIGPLLRSLASVREQRGEWEAAYALYKQLGDQDALADVIERAGTTMVLTAVLTLETWLNELAPHIVKRRPRLLSLQGAVEQIRGHAEEAIRLLDAAIAKLGRQDDPEALAVARTRRGHAHSLLGGYEQAIQDANVAMKLTEGADNLQTPYAEALRLRGLNRFYQGRSEEAAADLEEALGVYVRLGDSLRSPRLLMESAMVRANLGEYRRAEASYEKALAAWRESGNLFYQATLLNNYGFLKYQLGEYESAAEALEEGLLCAKRCGYTSMEAMISASMGDLYSEIEDFEIAANNYRNAELLAGQTGDRFLINYLQVAEANLALLKHEPAQARSILERASAGIRAAKSRFESGHLELAWGRLALQEGDQVGAEESLLAAKQYFSEDGREMESASGSIWLASAWVQAGEAEKAAGEIKAVLSNPREIRHSAVVASRQAMGWLEPLRNQGDARSLMGRLIDQADRLDDQLPSIRRQLRRMARTIEVPAPTLTIHAFGRGQVWVNGRLISGREWQTQAVRELFFFFIAMGKPVTKEQVGSVLWPEATEPARLRLRFKNEIYRLRRALGQATIVYDDEYYQLNPAADHEYDVEAFEAYLRRAASTTLPADRIRLYQQAVDLVGGEYLEDFGAVWVQPERERLRQEFIAGCLQLGELYLEQGQSERALETCQRLLERDPTSEAAYRLKMTIHRRLGDTAGLMRTYQDCEESLRGVFGMPPSKETEEHYQKLIA
jgi:LuxR family maltose regulon positive regulatory protein